MSWPIRFIASPPLHPLDAESAWYDGSVDFQKLAIGDMCFYHHQGKPYTDREHLAKLHLTAQYFAANAKRSPLILALPRKTGGTLYFTVDGQCYNQERGYYDGWTVTGEPPNITVAPSVDYGAGNYHGFIQNGVIGDG